MSKTINIGKEGVGSKKKSGRQETKQFTLVIRRIVHVLGCTSLSFILYPKVCTSPVFFQALDAVKVVVKPCGLWSQATEVQYPALLLTRYVTLD